MRIIARNTIHRFVDTLEGDRAQRAVKTALDAWYHEASHGKWKNPADIRKAYASASIIDGARVVFNIKGNDYRLVAAVDYSRQAAFIKWSGSHADYDKIDVREVKYGDQTYQKRRGS